MLFIGGFTRRQVLNTAKRLIESDIIPILDYAKEGSRNLADVDKYCQDIRALTKDMSQVTNIDTAKTSLALKASSFLVSENATMLMSRLIAKHAIETKCRLIMFDAEQPWAKAFEDVTFKMLSHDVHQRVGTEASPILFKTFQAYRKDCASDIENFINKYHANPRIGIKLVRGAYWQKGDDTFYQDKRLTDINYNMCLRTILQKGNNIPMCIATHNKESVDIAKSLLPNDHRHVYFAQLLGMGDEISNDLKNNGYQVMKYVPYGTPVEMLPYLYRRLVENVTILSHVL